jgi:arylsulfatase A-like enzyme
VGAGLLAGLVLSGTACQDGALSRFLRKRPPVVLISVDTLRADRLPAYGFKGVETPAIDALRRDSVLFENAFSHVPLTLPSHATIFTGRLPAANGVRDNSGYKLRAGVLTLAEVLKGAGYATGGAVSAIVLAKSTGISRGFDFWDDQFEPSDPHESLGSVQRAGAVTETLLEEWIAAQGRRPFFAFLHLYEPHTPYAPPEPFASRYAADPYVGEIAAADFVVGRLLDFLKAKGLYDRALIIFLSDHGEGLGDHGEPEHGALLYRETLRVPLLVKRIGERQRGVSISGPVGLADVFPTVLEAAGVGRKEGGDAISLLETAAGRGVEGRRIFSETLYPRLHFGWSDLASLSDVRWKYIEAPRPEIYDVVKDPGERRNLIQEMPEGLRPMKAAMERIGKAFEPPGSASAERRAQLASLGYLTGAVPSAAGPLPDPKDKIGLLKRMREGATLAGEGRDAEAAAVFWSLLEENPLLVDLWQSYAMCLFRMGRTDEAIAAARKGLECSSAGASPLFLQLLAEIYLRRGNVGEALRHTQLAIEMGEPKAAFLLPEIYVAAGDWARAEEAAQDTIRKSSYPALPHLILARVLAAKGDYPRALGAIDDAAAAAARSRAPTPPSFHHFRGDVLFSLGRVDEAEREYREEMLLFPRNAAVCISFARLLAGHGRAAEARATLDALLVKTVSSDLLAEALVLYRASGDPAGAEAWRRRCAERFPKDSRFRAQVSAIRP